MAGMKKKGVMKKRPKKMGGGGMPKKGVMKKRPTGMKSGKSVRKAVKKRSSGECQLIHLT